MAAPQVETVSRGNRHRPPPKIFLGIAALMFGINHLSVVVGNGLVPEALVMGCWLGMMGGWVLVAVRSFDAVWGWADPSDRRMIGLALLTLVAAIGLAEAVARLGYGQPLLA